MDLKLNIAELKNILELFYTMSGIRIVIFDANYNEILAYPKSKCKFCSLIHSTPPLSQMCRKSDMAAFEQCKSSDEIYIYKCHFGLVEAIIPFKDNNKIIGYMMFGQITDLKDKSELEKFVKTINAEYGIECTSKGIRYRSEKQISAAAKLLEICMNYIMLKEMIIPDNNRITMLAKEYILKNLCSDIKISDICELTHTCRTKLYKIFADDCDMGIAEYIRKERLKFAYSLLKSGELSVAEISEKSGFSDYNYFSRVFKRQYGISPYKAFKKSQSKKL